MLLQLTRVLVDSSCSVRESQARLSTEFGALMTTNNVAKTLGMCSDI